MNAAKKFMSILMTEILRWYHEDEGMFIIAVAVSEINDYGYQTFKSNLGEKEYTFICKPRYSSYIGDFLSTVVHFDEGEKGSKTQMMTNKTKPASVKHPIDGESLSTQHSHGVSWANVVMDPACPVIGEKALIWRSRAPHTYVVVDLL